MNDLLIRRARLMEGTETVDVAIKDGYIADAGPAVAGSARQMIDAAGRLLIPAFVDAHVHLDTALVLPEGEIGSPEEASEDLNRRSQQFTKDDYLERGRLLLQKALRHATMVMRTQVSVDVDRGLQAVEAALHLKEEFSGKVDLQVIVSANGTAKPEQKIRELLAEALSLGVDGLGGAPYQSAEMQAWVDLIFALASKHDLFIELQAEDTDEPEVAFLDYIAAKATQYNYQGKVVVTHCAGLAAVDEETAARTINALSEAGISVIIMPSAFLYCRGCNDNGLAHRGVTRVRELQAAGVNVACASDHIRDAFRPFGNADMLEESLISAQVLQMGTPLELHNVLRMYTYNAAAAIGLDKYGTATGDRAELVLLDASNPQEAIIGQAEKV
ncbi:MAG: amidohydrolase family protein, partial [Clostridia bacterium]|nr:amidohydrolase family protein [Clostridia bacterium]